MRLDKPITTLGEFKNFIRAIAEILQIELMFGPSRQKVERIGKAFSEKCMALLPVLDTKKTGGKNLSQLDLPDNTILSEEAKKLVAEAQAEVLKNDFIALELGPFSGVLLLMGGMGGSMNPHGKHKHKCPNCGHVWEHSNMCGGNTHAHTCENCGTEQWEQYH